MQPLYLGTHRKQKRPTATASALSPLFLPATYAQARQKHRRAMPFDRDLAAWYRADRGVVADSARNISQWQDQSGNDRHLVQSTGAAQPLLTRADNYGNILLWSADPTQSIWEQTTSPNCTYEFGLQSPVAGDDTALRINNFDAVLGSDRFLQYILSNTPLANRSFLGQCWVKGEGTNIGKILTFRVKRNTGTYYIIETSVTLTAVWQKIALPTFTGLADTVGMYLGFNSPATNCANSFLLYGIQLIESDWDTTYKPATFSNLLLWDSDFSHSPWTGGTVPLCTFELGLTSPVVTDATAQRVNNFDAVIPETRFSQTLLADIPLADRSFIASCWIKGEGANIGKTVKFRLVRNVGTAYEVNSTITLTANWQHITLATFTGLADTVGIYLGFASLATNCANSFLVYATQLIESGSIPIHIPTTNYSQPAGLHGWPTLLFNGASHYLKVGAFTINQPETIYLLFRLKSAVDDRAFFDGQSAYSVRGYKLTGASTWRFNAGAALDLVTPPAINSWAILGIIINGTDSLITINGLTIAAGDLGANNAGGFTLGAIANGGTPANIQVGEVLLYAAAHNENTRLRTTRYLANRWGITI